MKNKTIMENIGQFTIEKEKYYYVDNQGKVWSQQMIADIIKATKGLRAVLETLEHYKKNL